MTSKKEEKLVRTRYAGDLWLVPEHTDKDRVEMTYEESDWLRDVVLPVFPGAQIVSISKKKKRGTGKHGEGFERRHSLSKLDGIADDEYR